MNTTATEAPQPFVARETETLVLGACLQHADLTSAFLNEGLRPPHFFSSHHRTIWQRLEEAVKAGDVADWSTLRARLAKHGELEDVSAAYLSTLMDGVPFLRRDAVQALTRRLVECSVGRETSALLQRAQGLLADQPTSLTEGFFAQLDGSLRSLTAQLAGRRVPDHLSHVSQVMQEVRASLLAGPPPFVDTPWPALNSMLGGGFAPGELTFMGARPGLGKTAAAVEIARRTGKRGSSVLVVSREMLTMAIGMRMLAQEGPVSATALRKRDLSPQHWSTIDLAIETLESLPIFLTHARLTVDEIRKLVGLLTDEAPLGLVIVDYLQLIDAAPEIRERRLQVEAVSAGLKGITLDYETPVLCLSSLSRPVDGKAPTLASLRESGNLEHDADTVILLHRPEEMQPLTECIVAKSRNGRTGKVELYFRGEYLRFEEQTGPMYA